MNRRWVDHFHAMAQEVAKMTKGGGTQVGCVLVGPDYEIRSTGFAGIPRGVADSPERFTRPTKYNFIGHAEENSVAQAARIGVPTKGCTAFVTHMPCACCARMLIQAGIDAVYYGPGTLAAASHIKPEQMIAAATMFAEASVFTLPIVVPDWPADVACECPRWLLARGAKGAGFFLATTRGRTPCPSAQEQAKWCGDCGHLPTCHRKVEAWR